MRVIRHIRLYVQCALAAALVALGATASAQTAVAPSGEGTSESPYQITQLGNVVWMNETVGDSAGKHYRLMNDIDASETAGWNGGQGFSPIGGPWISERVFKGNFDGTGHAIRGLVEHVEADGSELGLFGVIGEGGVVRSLALIDVSLTGSYCNGGIASINDGGVIRDCFVNAGIQGPGGAIVGKNWLGTIERCYATGTIDVPDYAAGGIADYCMDGTVTQCYASVRLSGLMVGGLVRESAYGGSQNEVASSYWDVEISGTAVSSGGGEGKTSAQMRQAATFEGWDFTNVWGIVEGASTPYLRMFAPQFTLNVVTQGMGRIEIVPLKAEYAPGERVALTAYSDAPGYVFKGWGGGESNALTTVTTVTMSGHRTLLATFVPATDISTVEELQSIGDMQGNYRLAQDIDATATTNWNSGAGFSPLGNWSVAFSGVFDGNGHVIRGLTINRPGQGGIGLFCRVGTGGIIRKVGVVGGAVMGGVSVGGLVGKCIGCKVEQCYSTCSVTGTLEDVGGLAGSNEGGSLFRCYATGSVTRGGNNDFSVDNIGGLIGSTWGGVIERCYAMGNVTGFNFVGGLIGDNGFGSTVRQCYAIGDVSGNSAVGGLIGQSYYGPIRQCFATGDVAGDRYVGGLVCSGGDDRIDGNETVLGECYAMGLVKSQFYGEQGLVRYSGPSSFKPSAYWDVETSAQRDSYGYSGRTSARMKQQVTFVGWDFDTVWGIEEGVSYPYLRSDGPAFLLNVSVVGSGKVTVNPQKNFYVPGEKVTLTARPDAGTNIFASWIGGVADKDAFVTTVTMDIHKTVTAVFAKAIDISTVEELQKIGNDANFPPTSNYRLTQDIDATCTTNWNNGAGFMPIIGMQEPFSGVFEGNGHVVYGLYVNRPQKDYVGLFGRLDFEKELRHIDSVGVVGGIVRRVGLVGGSLTGRDFVGGLVGANEDRGRINGCYVESSVTGSGKVGGLAGYNVGVIEKSYVAGRVTGSSTVGGLVGETDYYGRIKQCYAAGVVSGGATVGGLIGDNYDGHGVITNSYWDVEVSGCATSAGGEGKTTSQMKQKSTYEGWDFSTEWRIVEGVSYPELRGGVAFAKDSEVVSEAAGTVTLTVNRGLYFGAASVTVSLQPGTATAADYTEPPAAQMTLSWAADDVGPKTVTIPIKTDAVAEADETFYVLLGSPTDCVIDEPSICQVTITDANRGDTLADALDNVLLKWTTGGTPLWIPQGAVTFDGEDAAASGAMASNKVSYVQTTVTGTGTLSFAWAVTGKGVLRLYDGTKVLSAVTNDTAWEPRTFSLTQNVTHTLKWSFTQGGDLSARAYLDQVVWLPGSKTGVAVTVNADAPSGGTATGTGVYYAGAKVPLYAKPRPGWLFTGWTPTNMFVKPLTAAQILTVGSNAVTVTANFMKVPVVTGLPCPPEGGTVTGSGICLPGKAVTLKAAAAGSWWFMNWSDGLQTAARSVSADEDVTLFAVFKLISMIAPPVITNPGAQTAMVGVPFNLALQVDSECLPAVTLTGLPSGLAYIAATKTIAGVPTVSVTNKVVTITAKNVNVKAATQTFVITVYPLPVWAQGSFNGVAGTESLGAGSASMSVSALGAASGKLTLRGTNFSFSAKSYAAREGDGSFTLAATATVGKVAWPLTVAVSVPEITDATGTVPQTLSKAEGVLSSNGWTTLYRNIWKDAGMVTVLTNRFTGYCTAVLPGGSEYGSGYLAFTVDNAGGVKTTGKLADGTPVSLAGTLILDEAGRVFAGLYTAPAAYKGGGLFGLAEFVKGPGSAKVIVRPLGGEPFVWESLNPMATGDYYAGGFSRELGLTGGWYDTLGNLYAYYMNGALSVGTEGAPVPEIMVGTNRYDSAWWDPDGIALAVVTNGLGVMTGLAAPKSGLPVKVGRSNVYDYATGTNTAGLTIGLKRATGVFKGAFKAWFDYAATHTSKTILYEGVLTPEREDKYDGVAGRGFFLWADKAQYTNSYNRITPYNFNWSYDLKILLPAEMVLVQGGSLPDIGNGAITVSSFYIGKCEVTWAEWQTVRDWAAANGYIGSVGAGSADNHPVYTVNWYDCVKWCNARSEKEGRMPVYFTDAGFTLIYKAGEVPEPFVNAVADGYRLPTDAEWEFAARGGTQSLGYEYSGGNDLNAVGWYVDNSDGEKTVGTKAANELGLYDMSGNVWEWCFDWYPGKEGSNRVIRGGSCYNFANYCRSAYRDSFLPYYRYFFIFGFRAARTLP